MAQLKDLLVSGAARFLNGLNINGDFILAGNLLPAETNKYNLGDSDHRWLQTQTKYLSVGAGDISSSGYEAVISGDLHTTGYSLFDDYVQIGGTRPTSYKFYVNGTSNFTNYLYINRGATNAASLFWNKNGTYYGGIGYGGTTNENYFGPCNSDGTWANANTDSWNFRGLLKSTNYGNTVTIGSQNSTWTHIYNSTDIPFIFNKNVYATNEFVSYRDGTNYQDRFGNGRIELYNGSPYIDFHFANTTTDFTSRLIETASGYLEFQETKVGVNGTNTGYNFYVNGISYFNGNIFIPESKSLIQNQKDTSNYTISIKWYKGSKSQNTYDPQIGQHNTGGTNSAGSIIILPYATTTDPWGGTVGLYITKNVLKLDGNRIPTAGSNGTVGNGINPIYSNEGVLTASSSTIGSSTKGVYLNAGTITAMTYELGANIKSYSGSLSSGGWAALNGKGNAPSIAIAYNNSATSWNSGTYSASLVFGCQDTRGLLDCSYNTPIVTFGGCSYGGASNDAPTWYFKLSGTSGTTYDLNNLTTSGIFVKKSGDTMTGVLNITNTTAATSTTTGALKVSGGVGVTGNIYGTKIYGAVWNDYAEYRNADKNIKSGQCVVETGFGNLILSTKRLQPGANIVSDTFGFAIGETKDTKTPLAVSGRVLAYPYEDRKIFAAGDPVCSGPNGTISKMTREEVCKYPDRIIGTVSEIPEYETWGTGNVKVDGRIWIKVR